MASYDQNISHVQVGGGSKAIVGAANNNNTTNLYYSQYAIILQ